MEDRERHYFSRFYEHSILKIHHETTASEKKYAYLLQWNFKSMETMSMVIILELELRYS